MNRRCGHMLSKYCSRFTPKVNNRICETRSSHLISPFIGARRSEFQACNQAVGNIDARYGVALFVLGNIDRSHKLDECFPTTRWDISLRTLQHELYFIVPLGLPSHLISRPKMLIRWGFLSNSRSKAASNLIDTSHSVPPLHRGAGKPASRRSELRCAISSRSLDKLTAPIDAIMTRMLIADLRLFVSD